MLFPPPIFKPKSILLKRRDAAVFNNRPIVKKWQMPNFIAQSFFGPNLFERFESGSFCFCFGAKGLGSGFFGDSDFGEPPPNKLPRIDISILPKKNFSIGVKNGFQSHA